MGSGVEEGFNVGVAKAGGKRGCPVFMGVGVVLGCGGFAVAVALIAISALSGETAVFWQH